MAYLSTACAQGADDNYGVVRRHADEVESWIEDNMSLSEPISRADYYELTVNDNDYAETDSGEENFAMDALEEIATWYNPEHLENILIGHEIGAWGYGKAHHDYDTSSGETLRGATVYVGAAITKNEKGLFCWHEAGHNWGAFHPDAEYRTNDWNEIVGATPMISGYLIDEDDDSRTTYCATADGLDNSPCNGPDPLNNGQSNNPTQGYYHDFYKEFDYRYAPNAQEGIREYFSDNF